MGMRRFTRLTNGFSKKVENLAHAVSLHYMHYNFARPHKSLGKGVTPAMAAGEGRASLDRMGHRGASRLRQRPRVGLSMDSRLAVDD
jgi:hypothetical protein